jgi:hypothetical protein
MDPMDQWTKTMEKMWAPWQKVMGDFAWPPTPDSSFQGKWSTWFAAFRSSYEINFSWWQTFMEQSEEVFFKALKESPMHSQSLEEQLREFWETLKKSQKTQQDFVKEQMLKIESLLKEKEVNRSA